MRAHTEAEKKVILNRVLRVWLTYPQLRLGQLLVNAGLATPYYVEDKAFAELLERYKP